MRVCILLLSVFFLIGVVEPQRDRSYADGTVAPQKVVLYIPNPAHYKSYYDADTTNSSVESWDDYWSWIQQFYSGSLFDAGWTAHASSVLTHVPISSPNYILLMKKLNKLGFDISKEWSKDNGVRKIDTGDLQTWSAQIQAAASTDPGNGSAYIARVTQIQHEVDALLQRRPTQ